MAVSTLTLTAPKTSPVLKAITFTGALSFGNGGAVPPGTPLAISRTGPTGTTPTPLPAATATTSGAFTFTDTPKAGGTYSYQASYAGSGTTSPAKATYYVTVTKLATALKLSPVPTTVDYLAPVRLSATLGGVPGGRPVSFYAQRAGSRTRSLLATATTSSSGVASVVYRPSATSTVTAVFSGDALHAPATAAGRTIAVLVKVTQVISGYYGSETYQGLLYRVYHHTATLKDTVTVVPNKRGECATVQIQVFFQGAWVWDVVTGCGYLTSGSQVFGSFNLAQAAGARYRIRATFSPARSDVTNRGNVSAWLYFRVAP